jgi:hypothetical protein
MKTSRADLRRALEQVGRRPVPARSQDFVDDLETRLVTTPAHQMRGRAVSTSKVDIRRSLAGIAQQPTPVPSASFVADLERRLLEQAGAARPERVAVLTPRSHRPRLAPMVSAAAAVVAALVLAGALGGWFGSGPTSHDVALTAAVDTTVTLPDGSVVDGRTGLTLPDGAVVRTGPNGHASAGDVELGPDLEAVVNDGHLELRKATPVSAAPAATPSAPAADAGGSGSGATPSGGGGTGGGTPSGGGTPTPPSGSPSGGNQPTVSVPPVTVPTITVPNLPKPPVSIPPLDQVLKDVQRRLPGLP